jgi:outer membrane protein assembly factor BamB
LLKLKSKTVTIAIAMFFVLSISASTMQLPNVTAQSSSPVIKSYAYIAVDPNPVGVGQAVTVDMWLSRVLPGAELGNDVRWHDYELIITDPDGVDTTQHWNEIADPTANQIYSFIPSVAGEYTFTFNFPGQTYTWEPFVGAFGPVDAYGNVYGPASAETTLVVQEEPLSYYPTTPLPTQYWTRPIYGLNPNWYTISSNWLGQGAPGYSNGLSGASAPNDAVGPLTGHVMWTKPMEMGGIVGGDLFSENQGDAYFEGSAYQNRFINPIIVCGYLYYTEPISFSGVAGGFGGSYYGPTVCVDLRTGETVWRTTDVPALSFAYIYNVDDPNQHGVYPPILVQSVGGSFLGPPVPTTWNCYDAYTGVFMFSVTGIPTGASMRGPQGEYLIVSLVNLGTAEEPNYYLQEWNSSRLWGNNYSGPSTSPPVVPPISDQGLNLTATWTGGTVGSTYVPSMYDWNVSVSGLNSLTSTPSIEDAYYNNMLIGEVGAMPDAGNSVFGGSSTTPYEYFAVNLNQDESIGTVLWTNTVKAPTGNLTVSYSGAEPTANSGAGVFTEYWTETMQFVGYSMATGKQIWGPTTPQNAYNFYATGYGGQGPTMAYGKMYEGGYGGVVYCYDLDHGDILWTYGNGGEGNSTNAGLNFARPYPTIISAIGNGVVYTITSEHTTTNPIYKGALARAINATTGEEIWTLSNANNGGPQAYAIADGYSATFNGYDDQIYVVGKGPTTTTVSAPDLAAAFGTPIVIKGTVMDISAGTTQDEQAARFPNGVPAMSDASMKDWMAYVYQQQTFPADAVGVDVTISVIDSNNNCYDIGTTTTDANGFFSYEWTPAIPGKFTVFATFEGTNGYWPSQAETALTVMQAPAATPGATPTPAPMTDIYVLSLGIGAIVAIIAIGLVLVLMLRKR